MCLCEIFNIRIVHCGSALQISCLLINLVRIKLVCSSMWSFKKLSTTGKTFIVDNLSTDPTSEDVL